MKLFYNIALVGRPNVGKSRLFNRLAGKRISIVHDMPGVTRDIVTHEIGKNIVLMDTGGLGLSGVQSEPEITSAVDEQVDLAITAADLVIFVVDAKEGIMPLDYDIADKLRKSCADVVVVVNKIDCLEKIHLADEFRKFGFGLPIAVSAEHGVGEGTLRSAIAKKTQGFLEQLKISDNSCYAIKVAFVGRPNVGKSSIINTLVGSQRMITSDIPGTTREAVTVKFPKTEKSETQRDFELLDTAGLRPQNRITTSLDYFSSLRTHAGIISCDVIFLVIDATTGVTKLDKKIANEIMENGRGIIVVVNKWDIAQSGIKLGILERYKNIKEFQATFVEAVRKEFQSLPGVEVVFTAALSHYGVNQLLPAAEKLFSKMQTKIGTGQLNRVIQDAFTAHPPSTSSGKRFRIYYAVHIANMPFTFKMFCNKKVLLSATYEKYLLNTLRKNFDFSGCAIKLEFVEKDSKFSRSDSFEQKQC